MKTLWLSEQLQQILSKAQKSMIDQLFRNRQPSFARHFIKMIRVVAGVTNRSHIRISRSLTVFIQVLGRKSSRKQTVLYLKTSQILLQQVIAGQYTKDLSSFGVRVARTKRGLPRLIPRKIRTRILAGDTLWIRIFMTLFGVYRVIEFPGVLKLSTIVKPLSVDIRPTLGEMTHFLPYFFKALTRLTRLQLWSVSPTLLLPKMFPISKAGMLPGFASTSVQSVFRTAYTWWSDPLRRVTFIEWCSIVGASRSLCTYMERWGTDPKVVKQGPLPLGRLSQKEEAAGKIRVFAIVDCWTQWILRPLHDFLFEILKGIPQDGTFDQLAPLNRLAAKNLPFYASFDLSAATDRLPIAIQRILVSSMFGEKLASLWVNILTQREYELLIKHTHRSPNVIFRGGVGRRRKSAAWEVKKLRYAVGQPMGALSSWGMLALTHHALVQLASYQLQPIKHRWTWFEDYAVLGDDIVIANPAVAKRYLSLMTEGLGVEINLGKSIVSTSGNTMEFAKRFIVKGVDVSMFPFKEYIGAVNTLAVLLEVVRKYNLTIPSILTLLGYGYRAKANLSKPFSVMASRCKRLLLALFAPGGPYGLTWAEFLTMESVFLRRPPNNISSAFATFIRSEISRMSNRIKSMARLMEKACLLAGFTLDGETVDMKYPWKPSTKVPVVWRIGPYNYSHMCELVTFLYMEDIQTKYSLFNILQEKVKVWAKLSQLNPERASWKKLLTTLDEFYRAESLFTEISLPPEIDELGRKTTAQVETKSVKRWFVLTARFKWN